MRGKQNSSAFECLLNLIGLGTNICNVARGITDAGVVKQTIHAARTAYAAALRYAGQVSFSPENVKTFELSAHKLEAAISNLQEHLDSLTLGTAGIAGVLARSKATKRISEHSVLFYESDRELVENISRFAGSALGAGNSAIIVATQAHRDALHESLAIRGLNLESPSLKRRYWPLDVEETLARLMVNGFPDPSSFADIMNPLLKRAGAASLNRSGAVVVYGEIVAILWARQKADAAMELERFWNDLARTKSFSLLCGYPASLFMGAGRDRHLPRLCAEHTTIVSRTRLLNSQLGL